MTQPATLSVTPQPAGAAGIRRTLNAMAQLTYQAAADLQLRDFARRSVAHIAGHDFYGEIEQLFSFVRDEITYRRDPVGVELVRAPRHVLADRSGDCDDKTVLLCALLACLGHRTRFVVAGYAAPQRYSHVYCQVLTRQGWLSLDPTNERATVGWEKPFACRAIFNWTANGVQLQHLDGFKSIFKKVGKAVKKVGKVAVPIAAGFIPGVGPVASAAAEAALNRGGQATPTQTPAPVVPPVIQTAPIDAPAPPVVIPATQPATPITPAAQAAVDAQPQTVSTRGQVAPASSDDAGASTQWISGVSNTVVLVGGLATVGLIAYVATKK